jgi:hypothetical protein
VGVERDGVELAVEVGLLPRGRHEVTGVHVVAGEVGILDRLQQAAGDERL